MDNQNYRIVIFMSLQYSNSQIPPLYHYNNNNTKLFHDI